MNVVTDKATDVGIGARMKATTRGGMSEVDVAALVRHYFDFNPLMGAAMKRKILLLRT